MDCSEMSLVSEMRTFIFQGNGMAIYSIGKAADSLSFSMIEAAGRKDQEQASSYQGDEHHIVGESFEADVMQGVIAQDGEYAASIWKVPLY